MAGKGTNSIDFDFNEIKIVTALSNGAWFTKTISKEEIIQANGATRWYYDGFANNGATQSGIVTWRFSSNTVGLAGAVFDGTSYADYNSQSTTYLYYR